jgi:hypothetical protein
MLSSAPVEITYDIGQQAEKDAQERFRLRLRPSVLAGLMLCAGVAGAGFANFLHRCLLPTRWQLRLHRLLPALQTFPHRQ